MSHVCLHFSEKLLILIKLSIMNFYCKVLFGRKILDSLLYVMGKTQSNKRMREILNQLHLVFDLCPEFRTVLKFFKQNVFNIIKLISI
ncbi:hypothetical protein FFZ99_10845 [Leptospira interrogans]|nr:hypothetical protein A6J42_08230 [Leptospira interrogans serovar Copenhageni]ASP42743.1 hypothetical protein AMR47_18240 [Leptospira interrogans]ASV07614.1 hypothetical protein B2G47_04005 [Leptospira interrogans serovar Canicola]OMH68982.1 hypothetical protein BW243_04160 [Leptospira interrogans serovar Pomona]QOI47914.1 hypothetical protein Lepto898_15135 [Leptospira interrogans serovar Icterohaemorrhagiae]